MGRGEGIRGEAPVDAPFPPLKRGAFPRDFALREIVSAGKGGFDNKGPGLKLEPCRSAKPSRKCGWGVTPSLFKGGMRSLSLRRLLRQQRFQLRRIALRKQSLHQ